MSQRVTLEDVARRSGVSPATVSLVLREKPGINDETRRRVLDAARELGYRKKPAADPLAAQALQQIGVVMRARVNDPPRANPFYGPVLAGIEMACRARQINLLYATVPVDEDNHPTELPRLLQQDQLQGLLLVGAFVDTTIAKLMQRRSTPTVLVDAYAMGNNYDSVVSDNYRGAYQAVDYLIQRGHRHIGVVGGTPNTYPSIEERRRGYQQALRDRGIAEQYLADSHVDAHDAVRAALALLQPSPQITALFCCNDDSAIELMRALQASERRVPDAISLIGFDDIDLAAQVIPALTTMHIDTVGMGRLAVQLLRNRVEFPAAGLVTTVLRPTLIERQSVRTLSDS